jgi:hypothetical protein
MIRDFARGLWRLVNAGRGISVASRIKYPFFWPTFIRDWKAFNSAGGDASLSEIAPALLDRSARDLSGGGQYFFQDIWALSCLSALSPARHYDVGTRLDGFVGQATAVCPVVYVDIRGPQFSFQASNFAKAVSLNFPLRTKASRHYHACMLSSTSGKGL